MQYLYVFYYFIGQIRLRLAVRAASVHWYDYLIIWTSIYFPMGVANIEMVIINP